MGDKLNNLYSAIKEENENSIKDILSNIYSDNTKDGKSFLDKFENDYYLKFIDMLCKSSVSINIFNFIIKEHIHDSTALMGFLILLSRKKEVDLFNIEKILDFSYTNKKIIFEQLISQEYNLLLNSLILPYATELHCYSTFKKLGLLNNKDITYTLHISNFIFKSINSFEYNRDNDKLSNMNQFFISFLEDYKENAIISSVINMSILSSNKTAILEKSFYSYCASIPLYDLKEYMNLIKSPEFIHKHITNLDDKFQLDIVINNLEKVVLHDNLYNKDIKNNLFDKKINKI